MLRIPLILPSSGKDFGVLFIAVTIAAVIYFLIRYFFPKTDERIVLVIGSIIVFLILKFGGYGNV